MVNLDILTSKDSILDIIAFTTSYLFVPRIIHLFNVKMIGYCRLLLSKKIKKLPCVILQSLKWMGVLLQA